MSLRRSLDLRWVSLSARWGALIVLLWIAAGCAHAPAQSAPRALPERLGDTGLYADFRTRTLHPDVIAFAPQYPLWTDGAEKRRWIRLPAGTSIDASDPDAWRFPVGTRLWKEFGFALPVETRYLEQVARGEWRMATYLWSEDGEDAVLAPVAGVRGAVMGPGGVPYDVPSATDCLACHRPGRSPVLGFTALQLSPERDPLAPHGAEGGEGACLQQLAARGVLANLSPALRATPPRIEAADPRERAVLGYLHGNCSSCHDGGGPLSGLGLDLAQRVGAQRRAPREVLAQLVDSAARVPVAGWPDGAARIASGAPEASVLVARLASTNPMVRMPPIGTRVPDAAALELVGEWVRGLGRGAAHAFDDPGQARAPERELHAARGVF